MPLHLQSHGQSFWSISTFLESSWLPHTQVWCCNTMHHHQTVPPFAASALQVYAYTTSDLQTAVLKMFTRAECRLPNLYVGLLTRESVNGALTSGITADQVVQYLRQHAHPQVQRRSPMVPEVGPAGSADCGWLCSARSSTHLRTAAGVFWQDSGGGQGLGSMGSLKGAGSKG